ncbi:hypothetical protein KL930_001152 [Ogataea haglerorum]|uniref:Probable metalloprotease ARX1 n=1 Tax=Ogataea haglerorum TaxID=1937702 RepID=A0AAN6HXY9_9ASCO|nr:uncharacterized protein KL911_004655 [Ogataea haglerorum]KAG7691491.1 hypothetical protein KL915_005238 [Ogataea haglerorum]KAG7698374.1 hypothetical protein KL951_001638 [Ogataea haglerorum]KAG7713115.1 hypothetical protein KL913_005342 [Ogataea haglerorum]KAG7719544.1 hypothetical protein KL949_002536 [Ogataea haglerorum]KAG7723909.1 hypothetical protein KL933_005231 [Ogataea haglerorum]
MELAVSDADKSILLEKKNVLNPSVLDKYRLAGQITQTCMAYLAELINDSYHLGKHEPYSIAELCLLGDSHMKVALDNAYKNQVREKGIAQPVTIDVNDVVVGYSPEVDDETNFKFKAGDIVTINMGCHIDGYTSNLSHTMVIYPPGASVGPLLGSSADAICASYIASETVIALLALSLTPEKIPQSLADGSGLIKGSTIRQIVDSIAESFNCVVVPTSKVRRIRRFLAGQAEGIVAERDFKGVVWSEADQELKLLKKSPKYNGSQELATYDKTKSARVTASSAVPTDDFVVSPGEVYTVDIKMAPLQETEGPGLITLQAVDNVTGANHSKDTFRPRPSIFVRDVAISHQLKLKTSRKLLSTVDNKLSVYPFKLAHLTSGFPFNLSGDIEQQLRAIQQEMKPARLGLVELVNKHLVVAKPILRARFVPLQVILNASTSTGVNGYDAENPVLPGLELPLPRLGLTSLKLKSLLKASREIPVAREQSTVVLNGDNNELIRLSGGLSTSKPSWVHSKFQLSGDVAQAVNDLVQLTQDQRFGLKIKECQPMKSSN